MNNRTMWDGINTDVSVIKKLYKPGDKVAFYVDEHYAWTQQQRALFPVDSHVTITLAGNKADVADCETGAMTPDGAAQWVNDQRKLGYLRPTIYRSFAFMSDIRKSTGPLIMGVDWDAWVADYDADPSPDYAGEAAKQFYSTNGYDESEVYDSEWPHRSTTPVIAPITSPTWPVGRSLRKGDVGNAVEALQQALAGSGIPGVRGISVDGHFQDQTLTSVRNFQHNQSLNVDGVAGPITRTTLINLGRLNSAGQAAF